MKYLNCEAGIEIGAWALAIEVVILKVENLVVLKSVRGSSEEARTEQARIGLYVVGEVRWSGRCWRD